MMTESELESLARIYSSQFSDWSIQIAYCVAEKRWERCASLLHHQEQSREKFAAVIGHLLPKGVAK